MNASMEATQRAHKGTPNRRSLCRIVRYLFLFVGVLGPFKCHTLVL